MADIELPKPSNTGWLIADTVQTPLRLAGAHGGRSGLAGPVDRPALAALCGVSGESASERVVTQLPTTAPDSPVARRPLLCCWMQLGRRRVRCSAKASYLDRFPALSLQSVVALAAPPGATITSAPAKWLPLCLELAGDPLAAPDADAYLDVFTHHHYLQAKHRLPPDLDSPAHVRIQALRSGWPVGYDQAGRTEVREEVPSVGMQRDLAPSPEAPPSRAPMRYGGETWQPDAIASTARDTTEPSRP